MDTLPTLRLIEDGQFTAKDCAARELLYLPAQREPLPRPQDVTHVLCLNLTRSHFQSEGSARFSDLTPESYALWCSITNKLAYCTDKKKRAALAKEKGRRKKTRQVLQNSGTASGASLRQSSAAVVDDDDDVTGAGADMEVEREQVEMRGAEFLSVYLETLFDGASTALVNGYRLWIFDTSRDRSGLDLLTRGVPESLHEAFLLQTQIGVRLDALNKAQNGQRNRPQAQRMQYDTARKYQWTQYASVELYGSLLNAYFIRDSLLLQQPTPQAEDPDAQPTDTHRPFTDTRSFLAHNQHGQHGQRGTRLELNLATQLSKEAAMIYHVESDNVALHQRTLRSYFEPWSEQVREHLSRRRRDEETHTERVDRLQRLLREQVPDSAFCQFPHPSTTYRIDTAFLSMEVLADAPLPHRLGTHLYVAQHLRDVWLQVRDASPDGEPPECADADPELWDARQLAQPLGLDQMQWEVTAGLLHQHQDLLSEEMRRQLTARHVSESVRVAFANRMRNQVMQELQQTQQMLKGQKTDLVEQVTLCGRQVVGANDQWSRCFRASTAAAPLCTRHKQHLLDRCVWRLLGRDDSTEEKERQRALAQANVAHYRAVLGRYRPAKASVQAVYEATGMHKYDATFMERDVYLVLDALNEHAFGVIDAKYLDEQGRVREGQEEAYRRERRELMEAACVEWWDEFFTNPRVSPSNEGIRKDLMRGATMVDGRRWRVGRWLAPTRFDVQTRPYHLYKLWIYAYFAEQGAIHHHYKVMDLLYHAKFHHCRFYRPGCKDPKLNIVLSGQGMGGKSHRLNVVIESCPTDVCEAITHWTPQSMNVDMNMSDMLTVHEEMSNKLVGAGERRGDGGHGTSDSAQDDARNNFKERATSGQSTTRSFYVDEETGDRRSRLSKCQCQGVILGATNNNLADIDPNVATRFVIVSVPRSRADNIFDGAHKKNKAQAGRDGSQTTTLVEEQREIHRVYYMIETLIRSGVLGGDNTFGCEVDGADLMINRVLDELHSKYRIPTNDVRKRKHVLEMARCKCIASAVWFGLTSPLTRHLFYDPYTQEYIGLNPRVLLEGIVPYLVVTKDHVIDALTCLSSLWGHEYQDAILENFACSKCKLQELRTADFLHRPKDTTRNAQLDSAPLTSSHASKTARRTTGLGLGGFGIEDQLDVDYNYILLTSPKAHAEIYALLSMSSGDLCVAPNDICKILKDLSRTYINCASYKLEEEGSERRLVLKPGSERIDRKAVDLGVCPVTGRAAIAVSVAFLKQKLPHLFDDSLIEDLTLAPMSFLGGHGSQANTNNANGVANAQAQADVLASLRNALLIERNDANETCLLRAIKDVLENDVLELTGDMTPEEEELLRKDYGDVLTGELPWMTYVTSEHPAPIPVSQVFPDLIERYSALPGHNKEIPLVDKPACIQLQRRPEARPMIIYNHTTVSPITKACLSIYDAVNDAEAQQMRQQQQEDSQKRAVRRRRFMLYAETPTFRVDRDVDAIYCESHLRNMAMEPRDQYGRLLNYPPHVYQQLIDHRDEEGAGRPFLQPFIDVLDRLRVSREMIGATIGDDSVGRAMSLSKMQLSNYGDPVEQLRVAKRRAVARDQERERAMQLLNGTFDASGVVLGQLKTRKADAPLEHGRQKRGRTTPQSQ